MNRALFEPMRAWLIFGLMSISLSVFAEEPQSIDSKKSLEDKSSEIGEGSQPDEESSNFFEFKGVLGAGYISDLYLGQDFNFVPILAITFDAEYEGWFVESNSKSRISAVMGRVYIGYHFWQKEAEQLDLVWGHYTPSIDKTDFDDEVVPELANLDPRRDDELLGIRYSNWIDDTYYSAELAYDALNNTHDGFVFEGYYGKVSSFRNWDFTYGVGYTWYSAKTADYNLGVESHELSEQLRVYNSGAAYAISLEFSAQIPVSESWVLDAGIITTHLSSNIKNSPLVVSEQHSSAMLGFSYVF